MALTRPMVVNVDSGKIGSSCMYALPEYFSMPMQKHSYSNLGGHHPA